MRSVYLLSVGVSLLCCILFASILFVNTIQIGDGGTILIESVRNFMVLVSAMLYLVLFWIVITYQSSNRIEKIAESVTAIMLLVCLNLVFALVYRTTGVYVGRSLVIPNSNDAIEFSVCSFIGISHYKYSAGPAISAIFLYQSVLGYLVLPILITFFVNFIDRGDNTSLSVN